MRHNSTIVLLAFWVLFSQIAISQTDDTKKGFTISLAPNLTFYGISSEDFNAFSENQDVHPGVGLGVDVDFGPLWTILDLNITSTLVIAYAQYQTDEIGKAMIKMQVSHLPILVGARLASSGRLRPFIRLLAGVSRSRLKISSDVAYAWNISTFRWEPCLAGGAGFEFDISESLGIAASVDQWMFFSKLVDEDQSFGLPYRHAAFNYSIRFSYRFSNSN